jgi:hypothetical protein
MSKPASPQFDECGFERCEFERRHCGAYFIGVVDTLDGANLVSAETPNGTFYQVIPRNKDSQQHPRSTGINIRSADRFRIERGRSRRQSRPRGAALPRRQDSDA